MQSSEPFNPRWVIKNFGQNLKTPIKPVSLSELMRPHYNEIVTAPLVEKKDEVKKV